MKEIKGFGDRKYIIEKVWDINVRPITLFDLANTRYRHKSYLEKMSFIAVVIMMSMGHRCGYVGIPTNHPLYGSSYSKHCKCIEKFLIPVRNSPIDKRGILPVFCWDGERTSPDIIFNVHGGITYSNGYNDYPIETKDIWWFGYDCGHAGDAKDLRFVKKEIREIEEKFPIPGEIRSLNYCISECESLAKQLNEV